MPPRYRVTSPSLSNRGYIRSVAASFNSARVCSKEAAPCRISETYLRWILKPVKIRLIGVFVHCEQNPPDYRFFMLRHTKRFKLLLKEPSFVHRQWRVPEILSRINKMRENEVYYYRGESFVDFFIWPRLTRKIERILFAFSMEKNYNYRRK